MDAELPQEMRFDMKAVDISGRRFGRLVAIRRVLSGNKNQTKWLFKCDCGKEHRSPSGVVTNGDVKSCGCLFREISRRNTIERNTTHGMSKASTYNTLKGMRQRCNNPHNPNYKWYGARGISICKEWDCFATFLADMGTKPSPTYSVGRKDNDLGYSKENCRWETPIQQAASRRKPIKKGQI